MGFAPPPALATPLAPPPPAPATPLAPEPSAPAKPQEQVAKAAPGPGSDYQNTYFKQFDWESEEANENYE